MDGLAEQYAAQIDFKRVNILDRASQPLMEQYAFSAAPELYLLDRHGKIAASWDDVVSANDLRAALDQVLR